jgi:hypothetical protein
MTPRTPSQHINSILKELSPALRKKYLRGAKEHGGGLWKKNVGPEIENELLDLIVYVYTREEQVKRLVAAANIILEEHVVFDCIHLDELRAALAPFLNNEIQPTKGHD